MAPKTISNIPIISGILLALLNIMLTTTTMSIGTYGFSIRLVPISSLFPKNLTLEERHNKLVEISKNHALHLQQCSKINGSSTSPLTSTKSTTNLAKELAPNNTILLQPSVRCTPNGYYIAHRFPFSTYRLIDTGSNPSWVQCESCQSCFPLNGTGNFKYTQSQSFRRLPCNNSLSTPKLCDERGYCRYNAKYLRSSSQGVVLTDTFTFPADSSTTTAKYPNLAFGCGLTNENLCFGKDNNKIAGIMGLGLEKKFYLGSTRIPNQKAFLLPLIATGHPNVPTFWR